VFDHISKHLEVRQKYFAARRIFNSLLGVWKCGQTRSFAFDISNPIVIFLQQVGDNELPDCVVKSMYFCEHTSSESTSDDHSKRNPHEAREITEVAKTFCQKGRVDPSKITVLCAYRGQASV